MPPSSASFAIQRHLTFDMLAQNGLAPMVKQRYAVAFCHGRANPRQQHGKIRFPHLMECLTWAQQLCIPAARQTVSHSLAPRLCDWLDSCVRYSISAPWPESYCVSKWGVDLSQIDEHVYSWSCGQVRSLELVPTLTSAFVERELMQCSCIFDHTYSPASHNNSCQKSYVWSTRSTSMAKKITIPDSE